MTDKDAQTDRMPNDGPAAKWEPPTLTEVEFHETAASAGYTLQSDGALYSGTSIYT